MYQPGHAMIGGLSGSKPGSDNRSAVMKTLRKAGALVLVTIAIASLHSPKVHADSHLTEQTNILLKLNISQPASFGNLVVEPLELPKSTKPEPPKIIEYTVVEGDNLTKIAGANSTTWLRLWQKNTGINDPDLININDKLIIPGADEVLADRPVPINAPVAAKALAAIPRGISAGNTYSYGYCTWYVKNRRPDLPNNLGNAETWYSRAAAQGLSVGSTPVVGAVGQRGNHVVYVEAVNGDGTILISEMNYQAWNVQSSRTANASEFRYIY